MVTCSQLLMRLFRGKETLVKLRPLVIFILFLSLSLFVTSSFSTHNSVYAQGKDGKGGKGGKDGKGGKGDNKGDKQSETINDGDAAVIRSGEDSGYNVDPNIVTEAVTDPSTDCQTVQNRPGTRTELGGCIPKDPVGFAYEYYSYGLGLIGGTGVLFFIIGGYMLLTSAGDPARIRNGKTFIFYAIFGILLAVFGYVFIEVIAIDILKIPGFQR